MITETNLRSLRDLERSVKDLRKTKFEVLEVNSTRDRLKTNLTLIDIYEKEPYHCLYRGRPKVIRFKQFTEINEGRYPMWLDLPLVD